jgi:hypothetical protein
MSFSGLERMDYSLPRNNVLKDHSQPRNNAGDGWTQRQLTRGCEEKL